MKDIDERLYAQVKSEAAKSRRKVGELINEAISVWLNSRTKLDEEGELNMKIYNQLKGEIGKHPNEYVVIARGEFLGRFLTLKEAAASVKSKKTDRAIIIKGRAEGEWLGGSFQD